MNNPETHGPAWRLAPHVRAAAHGGGVVVLDLRTGRYQVPNAVGSLVWIGVKAGEGPRQIGERLVQAFDVPLERAVRDVETFTGALSQAGLIVPGGDAADDASATPAADPPPVAAPTVTPPDAPAPSVWLVAAAFTALVVVDVGVRLFGFRRAHALLRRLPAGRADADKRAGRRLARALDSAASCYFKRAWCLQRSLAAALLMRLCRWPARLVIAAQRVPFAAHAWVEWNGVVINDDPEACAQFAVLERC
jgi:hypothetical protein